MESPTVDLLTPSDIGGALPHKYRIKKKKKKEILVLSTSIIDGIYCEWMTTSVLLEPLYVRISQRVGARRSGSCRENMCCLRPQSTPVILKKREPCYARLMTE